jgi:hypothetical protein
MAVPAFDLDPAKIDRTIAKQPRYHSKPKYCLLVFGPEAKTRVWRPGGRQAPDQGERRLRGPQQSAAHAQGGIAQARRAQWL